MQCTQYYLYYVAFNQDYVIKNLIKAGDWNEIHIIAKGNHLQHFINGVLMSDAIDEDTKARKFKGVLGFQVHVMPTMKVEYKDIYFKNLKQCWF